MAEFPEDLSDIGRALVDGDYILVNKLKAALSRVYTHFKTSQRAESDIGAAFADDDEIMVDDQSATFAKRRAAISRFWTYVQTKGAAISEGGVALADADTFRFIDATDSTEKRALMSRLTTYLLAAIPIAGTTWTPTYSSESNCTSTTHVASRYLRVGSSWAFVTCFTTTRNNAATGKSFRMTLPSFISNNWADVTSLMGVGTYATSAAVTATNVRINSVASATTAEVAFYDTASSGTATFIIVGLAPVP